MTHTPRDDDAPRRPADEAQSEPPTEPIGDIDAPTKILPAADAAAPGAADAPTDPIEPVGAGATAESPVIASHVPVYSGAPTVASRVSAGARPEKSAAGGRRSRVWPWMLGLLAAVLLVGGLVAALLLGRGEPVAIPTIQPPSQTSTPSPTPTEEAPPAEEPAPEEPAPAEPAPAEEAPAEEPAPEEPEEQPEEPQPTEEPVQPTAPLPGDDGGSGDEELDPGALLPGFSEG